MEAATQSREGVKAGRVEAITGVVIEAVFPEELPEIYNALEVDIPPAREGDQAITLVCEVQQHLGDDRVRAVAMDATDGLSRGAEVRDTGAPITVPVGKGTLGRIFNLLGEPIDNAGDVSADERWPIHRSAPSVENLTPTRADAESRFKDFLSLLEPMSLPADPGRGSR